VNPHVGTSGASTALVNIALIGAAKAVGALFQAGDEWVQVCPFCLRCLDAKLFEVDHQQAWSNIRDKLTGLANAMQADSTVFALVQKERKDDEEFKESFLVSGKPALPPAAHPKGFKVQVTEACANMYSNDLKNLVRACRLCNAWDKSNQKPEQWFKSLTPYGHEFVEKIKGREKNIIFRDPLTDKGLGELVTEWFNQHFLPIMVKQKVVEQTRVDIHQRLQAEAMLKLSESREADPAKRSVLGQKRQAVGLRNTAQLEATRGVNDYIGSMGGGSVQDFSDEESAADFAGYDATRTKFVKGDQRNEKKKQKERERQELKLSMTPAYIWACAAARGGAKMMGPWPANIPAPSQNEEAAKLGFAAGLKAYEADFDRGRDEATLGQRPTAVPAGPPGYREGFQQSAQQREAAYEKGKTDGKSRNMDVLHFDHRYFRTLVADYQAGFRGE